MAKLYALFLIVMLSAVADGAVEPYERATAVRMMPAQSAALDRLARAGSRPPPPVCSDAVFLRRVYLDVLGVLPTGEEAAAFLADKAPEKRGALIDRLLARPEFADYWGMKWGDILRVKSEFPVNLWPNAAQAYDAWIRDALRRNMPYSEFARRLLTAAGSNFRVPEVNFSRAAGGRDPASLAASAALVFMGARTANWKPAQRDDLAAFFSSVRFKKTNEWKEEILVVEPGGDVQRSLRLPDGTGVRAGVDPRAALADWLVASPKSPFAANGANRIWFWLFGRGIVHEPDDFRPDNPPTHPALLDFLAKRFAESGYDTKALLRTILNSDTYQATSIPALVSDKRPAWTYPTRRVEAEVLVDAINRITGGADEYSSVIPEPFTFIPEGTCAVAIPDGSITSSVLEIFGRPPRDTGLLCERPARVTTAQRLQLLNSGYILKKLEKSRRLADLVRPAKDVRSAADVLYLEILSRHPTDDELAVIAAHEPPAKNPARQKFLDVAWALINSPEFLLKH